jgi:hypothetical protein
LVAGWVSPALAQNGYTQPPYAYRYQTYIPPRPAPSPIPEEYPPEPYQPAVGLAPGVREKFGAHPFQPLPPGVSPGLAPQSMQNLEDNQ